MHMCVWGEIIYFFTWKKDLKSGYAAVTFSPSCPPFHCDPFRKQQIIRTLQSQTFSVLWVFPHIFPLISPDLLPSYRESKSYLQPKACISCVNICTKVTDFMHIEYGVHATTCMLQHTCICVCVCRHVVTYRDRESRGLVRRREWWVRSPSSEPFIYDTFQAEEWTLLVYLKRPSLFLAS